MWWHYTNDAWWQVWHANIYVSKLKCQHEGKARVLTLQLRDIYICMSHSPSCVICFVTSLTKMRLNSKNLHFTGAEWYDNYVTITAASVKPRLPRRLSQWAHAGFVYIQCLDVTIQCHITTLNVNKSGKCSLAEQSRPVKYWIIANGMWLT